MRSILLFFIVVIACANQDGLVKLDKTNHADILKKNKNVIVKFFSPYCPHCVHFAPTYSEFSLKMQSEENLVVAELNCAEFRDVCGFYKIGGYPTVNFYSNGELVEKFAQKRTVENLVEFAKKNMK